MIDYAWSTGTRVRGGAGWPLTQLRKRRHASSTKDSLTDTACLQILDWYFSTKVCMRSNFWWLDQKFVSVWLSIWSTYIGSVRRSVTKSNRMNILYSIMYKLTIRPISLWRFQRVVNNRESLLDKKASFLERTVYIIERGGFYCQKSGFWYGISVFSSVRSLIVEFQVHAHIATVVGEIEVKFVGSHRFLIT